MQPLLPYLLGQKHPKGERLVDSQKCFRSGDIEEVGDNRHTTFFEMLGNWSLGNYFKQEQLPWFFLFLTDALGLDPARLYVTVFAGDEALGIPRDEEAATIWQELFKKKGIEARTAVMGSEAEGAVRGMRADERVFYYDATKNWWSRSGIPANMPAGEPGGPDSEVFYDFGTPHDTAYGAYCHPNCDCGRFLEIGNSVFMQYKKEGDGRFSKLPRQNVDFGGGLERLLMAAKNTPDIIAMSHAPIIAFLEKQTGKHYQEYGEDTRAFRIIADHMKAAVFLVGDGILPSNTDQGYFVRRLIRRAVRYADALGVSGEGFAAVVQPVAAMYAEAYPSLTEKVHDLEKVIADEEQKFRTTLKHGLQELDKLFPFGEGVRPIAPDTDTKALNRVDPKKAFLVYQTYGFPLELIQEELAKRALFVDEREFAEEMRQHQELSRKGSEQKFKGGLADASEVTTMLHTCTHLMLAGLRKYVGTHVHQAGSNITQERTRFDFTHTEKVPRDVLDKVEAYVNEAISKHCAILTTVMKKDVAKEAGIEGSFWEKYPDEVTVYQIRCDDGTVYSQELCGGPHVKNTGDIVGTFKIKKEKASSAGVRRIKAVLLPNA